MSTLVLANASYSQSHSGQSSGNFVITTIKPSEVGYTTSVLLTADAATGALYVWIGHGEVKETIEGTAKILVDINEQGDIIGIEILTTNEKILEAIAKSFQSKQ